jgi:hypothetical protein
MSSGLVNEDNLLRLSRLPWFRVGSIPNELRWPLINALDRAKELPVRRSLIAILEHDQPPKHTFAFATMSLELAVQRWLSFKDHLSLRRLREALKDIPSNEILIDRTLLGYLERVPNSRLTLLVPRQLRKYLYQAGIPLFGFKSVVRFMLMIILASLVSLGMRTGVFPVPPLIVPQPTPIPLSTATPTPSQTPPFASLIPEITPELLPTPIRSVTPVSSPGSSQSPLESLSPSPFAGPTLSPQASVSPIESSSPSPTATMPLTSSQLAAKEEADAAAKAYREGKFQEAEQHSRKAVDLDPANKTWRMFVARTVDAQYRPGVNTPENIAVANKAIEEYRNILAFDRTDEEAYKAIAYLYSAMKEDEKLRDWLVARANDLKVEPKKRSEAYVVLASKDWDCSFRITELPANKITSGRDGKVSYKKPRDPKDFATADMCVKRGLAEAENAIKFDPNSESAWSYKTNLLLEASKLAEMDGRSDLKALYDMEAKSARQRALELQPSPQP